MRSDEKGYYGLVQVTRIYKIGFESTDDGQALEDLKVIVAGEHFASNYESEKQKILEIRKEYIPGAIVFESKDAT